MSDYQYEYDEKSGGYQIIGREEKLERLDIVFSDNEFFIENYKKSNEIVLTLKDCCKIYLMNMNHDMELFHIHSIFDSEDNIFSHVMYDDYDIVIPANPEYDSCHYDKFGVFMENIYHDVLVNEDNVIKTLIISSYMYH